MSSARQLNDLRSIGPAMLGDFSRLGIHSVDALAQQEAQVLYDRLCHLTGQRQDPCVLDTFSCAIAQARDPQLPSAQCQWWWWSRKRKREAR